MDHFFKVVIEIVTIFLIFYVLFLWPRGIWDLSSLTRDGIHIPFVVRQSLNPWTTREVPWFSEFLFIKSVGSGEPRGPFLACVLYFFHLVIPEECSFEPPSEFINF